MELKYFPAMTYEELREAMRNLLRRPEKVSKEEAYAGF